MRSQMNYIGFFIVFLTLQGSKCFEPTNSLRIISQILDDLMKHKLGYVGNTWTHEDILRLGLTRSITKYFHEFNGKIDLAKADTVYSSDHKQLLKDFYGEKYANFISNCEFDFNKVLSIMEKAVESVDFKDETKDLPYAHFDAETFIESNKRVKDYMTLIYESIIEKHDYKLAAQQIGEVLHTIQDFYSHSNWIELGNTGINQNIGSHDDTFGAEIAEPDDKFMCTDNCDYVEVECGMALADLIYVVKKFTSDVPLECPFRFFRCSNNVNVKKLTSGYYINQKLPDGKSVEKPVNQSKCSHGGLIDKTSFQKSIGGINKDTAYYFLSPHANLHLQAANLAINHTHYFFDLLRNKVGDIHYENLLGLKPNSCY